jgi:cyanophycinase
VVEDYEDTMRSVGVRHLSHLKIESRADAESAKAMGVLEGATGVFFTGGDQLRLTTLIGDMPGFFSRCYEIFVNGGVIAGTSAGASVLSDAMIITGDGPLAQLTISSDTDSSTPDCFATRSPAS